MEVQYIVPLQFHFTYFEIMLNVLYDYMHKISLQIFHHETSMVRGRSFNAYVNVFPVCTLQR